MSRRGWLRLLVALLMLIGTATLVTAQPAQATTCVLGCWRGDTDRGQEGPFGWQGGTVAYERETVSVYGGACTTGIPVETSTGQWYMLGVYHCTAFRPRYDDDWYAEDGSVIGPNNTPDGAYLDPHYDTVLVPIPPMLSPGSFQMWATGGCAYGGCSPDRTNIGIINLPLASGATISGCIDGAYTGERCNMILNGTPVYTSMNGGPQLPVYDMTPNPSGAQGPFCQGGDSGGPVYYVPGGSQAIIEGITDAALSSGGQVVACQILDITTALERFKSVISPPTLLHVY